MRKLTLAAAALAVATLAACKDDNACTPEAAQAKATELAALSQAITTTDPAKIAKLVELTPKIADLSAKLAADPADATLCTGFDEVLAALK